MPPLSTYRIPAEGISEDVMKEHIRLGLGADATFKSIIEGGRIVKYEIRAYRPFTEEQMHDLREKSKNRRQKPVSRHTEPTKNTPRNTPPRRQLSEPGAQEPLGEEQENFECVIHIRDNFNDYRDAMALLDTQCDGNWISSHLVDRLGLGNKVLALASPVTRSTPSGIISTCKAIKPTWRLKDSASIRDQYTFYVFDDSSTYDVLFGKQLLLQERYITVNNNKRISVLSQHKDISTLEKGQISQLEEQRRREKAMYERDSYLLSHSSQGPNAAYSQVNMGFSTTEHLVSQIPRSLYDSTQISGQSYVPPQPQWTPSYTNPPTSGYPYGSQPIPYYPPFPQPHSQFPHNYSSSFQHQSQFPLYSHPLLTSVPPMPAHAYSSTSNFIPPELSQEPQAKPQNYEPMEVDEDKDRDKTQGEEELELDECEDERDSPIQQRTRTERQPSQSKEKAKKKTSEDADEVLGEEDENSEENQEYEESQNDEEDVEIGRDSPMGEIGETQQATSLSVRNTIYVVTVSKKPHLTRKDEYIFKDYKGKSRTTERKDWKKTELKGQEAWKYRHYYTYNLPG